MRDTAKNYKATLVCAAACAGIFLGASIAIAQAPKPKHINSAIEMLEQGQPIYYTSPGTGAPNAYEQGKIDAKTWADYISWDMEARPYEIDKLTEYMRGLKAGGPTSTGHPTPAVIANLPMRGTDEATVRANQWMVEQVLATGVNGLFLVHATTAGAVREFVEEVRFPNREQGVGPGKLEDGRRGAHGAPSAAKIWGITPAEYQKRADVWPLNPNGEILIGLKIEDKYALPNLNEIVRVPGITIGEGGPGDMGLSTGYDRRDPRGAEIQTRIFEAAKSQHLFWLMGVGGGDAPNLEELLRASIKDGHMIGAGEKTAAVGRRITNRPHPWPGE